MLDEEKVIIIKESAPRKTARKNELYIKDHNLVIYRKRITNLLSSGERKFVFHALARRITTLLWLVQDIVSNYGEENVEVELSSRTVQVVDNVHKASLDQCDEAFVHKNPKRSSRFTSGITAELEILGLPNVSI